MCKWKYNFLQIFHNANAALAERNVVLFIGKQSEHGHGLQKGALYFLKFAANIIKPQRQMRFTHLTSVMRPDMSSDQKYCSNVIKCFSVACCVCQHNHPETIKQPRSCNFCAVCLFIIST